MRYILTAVVFIVAMAFDLRAASARYEAPWCAVITVARGSVYWDCQYNSFEACYPNVISGQRGFCNHNPAYVPAAAKPKTHGKRYVKRN